MIRRNPMTAGNTFAQRMAMIPTAEPAKQESRVWLNVGYLTGDPEYPIATLPFGIPIDTQSPLKLPNGKNKKYLDFVKCRNGVLEEIQEAAKTLAPGEDMIIGGSEGGLVLQLRCRENDVEEDSAPSEEFFPAFKLKVA